MQQHSNPKVAYPVAIFLIACVSGAAYLFLQTNTVPAASTVAAQPATAAVYANSKYSYSFAYPKSKTAVSFGTDFNTSTISSLTPTANTAAIMIDSSRSADSDYLFAVYPDTIVNGEPSAFTKAALDAALIPDNQTSGGNESVIPVTINGISAFKLDDGGVYTDGSYFVQAPDKTILILSVFEDPSVPANVTAAQAILNSFKFTQ